MNLCFRVPIEADSVSIVDSWLKSYRRSPLSRHLRDRVYYHWHREVVAAALSRSQVLVAFLPEVPEEVIGWICFEVGSPFVMHYIYVKQPYRHCGIARQLLGRAGYVGGDITATHITYLYAEGRLRNYRVINNPYLLR